MDNSLNERSRDILAHVIEAYVETGEPVGSKTLSARLGMTLSAATIRNVMADLEQQGFLYAPHTSAGRLPTEAGLRFFVQSLMQLGDLPREDAAEIESQCQTIGKSYEQVLGETAAALAGLSRCAGLVLAPKSEESVRSIEFILLAPGRCLVVMVMTNGLVENRIIELAMDIGVSVLSEATNYLNAHLGGRTISEARAYIENEWRTQKSKLDTIVSNLVTKGLTVWNGESAGKSFVISGKEQLLSAVTDVEDIKSIRTIFDILGTKHTFMTLLEKIELAEGVQIFVGAQNNLFTLAGCSLIIAPLLKEKTHIVGAVGVIGPTRMRYGKVIPLVDYTAKAISRLMHD